MRKESVELVSDYCPTDCVYRVRIGWCMPACYYSAIEHQARGCKISECDKYRPGQPLKATMDREYAIYWEYDYYGKDDNSVW